MVQKLVDWLEANAILLTIISTSIILVSGFSYWLYCKMKPFFISHKRSKCSSKVNYGRYGDNGHRGMVVFLIGMKINRWYRIDHWLPILLAMSSMLKELQNVEGESVGYYGGETYGIIGLLFGFPTLQVMYWESLEKVLNFSCGKTHLQSMRKFMRLMGDGKGSVGVWHEMYEINNMECIHRDMPSFGILRALENSKPAINDYSSAENRLNYNEKTKK